MDAAALQAAAEQILARHGVVGLVEVQVSTVRTEVSKRKYKDRPAAVEVREESRVAVQVNTAAVAAQKRLCGWRVYATNHPGLTLPEAVLSDRGQYGIEHEWYEDKRK